jgi:hypothetical protein
VPLTDRIAALEQEVMGAAQPGGIAVRLSAIEASVLGASII